MTEIPADLTPRQRLMRALACRPVDRPPVWFMRQAGRYLPEYRKVRQDHSFLEVCHTPELAKTVTLQPVERFGLDAAIIFSDILVPLEGMGHPVAYEPGQGPVVEDPVRAPEDIDDLQVPRPSEAYPGLGQAIEAVREALPGHGVLGFAGAPFTLASYLIEGGSTRRYTHLRAFMLDHPEAFDRLLTKLSRVVEAQLSAQVRAGADAVQIFDSHADQLSLQAYTERVLPSTRKLLEGLGTLGCPRIHFALGTAHLMPAWRDLACEAISVDWRVTLGQAQEALGPVALQGNLDPTVLFAAPAVARAHTRQVLEDARGLEGYVFNLGHGIRPEARVDSVAAMVDTVKTWEAGA